MGLTTRRCPFCHVEVDIDEFELHQDQHWRKRPDGQHTDYVTLPKEEREQRDISDEPAVYLHKKCEVATRMPDEIIRSYLVNPYLYLADKTFCCGCGKHVHHRECIWVETGENVHAYMKRLRKAKPEYRPRLLIRLLLPFLRLLT